MYSIDTKNGSLILFFELLVGSIRSTISLGNLWRFLSFGWWL